MPAAVPVVEETRLFIAEYPQYEMGELVDEAARIVEVTVVSRDNTVLYPSLEPDDPTMRDDPVANPLSGATTEQIAQARAEGAMAATDMFVNVTRVLKGDVTAGETFVVTQIGGVMGDVLYVDEKVPDLVVDGRYLLFLTDGEKGSVLGGIAGAYEIRGSEYVAMSATAAVATMTSDEVAALVAGSDVDSSE